MNLHTAQTSDFLDTLWSFYAAHARHDLPWRQAEPDGSFDPYKILVSELMLQQTQVTRVVPKYLDFVRRFPDAAHLVQASLADVLGAWQGLGYNRRAKFLWQAARLADTAGSFPNTLADLVKLPGVGTNTAGAILAYAFNTPAIFVETNVRTVYIHHFLADQENIDDAAIRNLLEQTLDHEQPREFYWALMDYGSFLKSQVRTNHQSKHFTKQSRFEGSRRQIRGQVLKMLHGQDCTAGELAAAITDERLQGVLQELEAEGLVCLTDGRYRLGNGTI